MSINSPQQRMIENETVFRNYNEQVQRRLNDLKAIAKEDAQEDMVPNHDMPLYFFCECADENCKQRVQLPPSKYNQIHKNRSQFVIVPGHQALQVEKIVAQKVGYDIVEKHKKPPENITKLQHTPIDNT